MRQDFLDIIREVLDHEVVDSNDVPCGMVDDIELEGGPGSELRVKALLVGVGVWSDRLPKLVGRVLRWTFGGRKTRVPWSEVSVITERVKLKSRASELGLGIADRKASRLLKRLPGS